MGAVKTMTSDWHHIGLLPGTALVAGPGGTALSGALGLLTSIPMLVRLYRRFGSWVAPVLGLVVFAAMFSLSAFVIGPPSAVPDGTWSPVRNPPWGIRETTPAGTKPGQVRQQGRSRYWIR